jgi:hypothetical protein
MVVYALSGPFYDGEEDDNMARRPATSEDGGLELFKTVFARCDIGRMKKRQAQAVRYRVSPNLPPPHPCEGIFIV